MYIFRNPIFYLILIIFSVVNFVVAQTTDSVLLPKIKKERIPTLGIALTGTSYIGDLTDNFMRFNRIYPGMNISLQGNLSNKKILQAQLNAGFGAISEQADAYPFLTEHPRSIRYISYIYTPFYYGDVRLKSRFFRKSAFRPYLSTGVGLYLFSPQDDEGNLLVEAPKSRPKGETYNTYSFYIPAAIGFDLRISKSFGLGLGYTFRNIFTDYTDNISQLGKVAGNDKLHQFQLTMYVTPSPAAKTSKPVPPIYIPPSDSTKEDSSTIIASIEKPKREKKHRKHREHQEIVAIVPEEDTAAIFFQPRPLTSLELSILDTTPQPQKVVSERFLSDTIHIFLDSALYVRDSFKVYSATRKYATEKTTSIVGSDGYTSTSEMQTQQEDVRYLYQNISTIDSLDTTNIQIWRYLAGEKMTEAERSQAESKLVALEKEAIDNKRFIYYEIKKWDTWEKLIQKFGVQKATIMRVNQLTHPRLIEGLMIRIPDINKH